MGIECNTFIMDLEQKLASLFRMTDEVWARHANPWSVWTRYFALPVFILSIWSRIWIGWWSAVPILLSIVWIWINPRVFAIPSSTKSWASKAVLGERVWLNRKRIPIPEHHRPIINILNTISAIGSLLCIWGLIKQSGWGTIFGMMMVILGKSWFLDRMVWLYDEMKDNNPDYRSWLY